MKISCPICFQQVEADREEASSIRKCPTCNNDLPIPEASTATKEAPKPGAESPRKATVSRKEPSSAIQDQARSSTSSAVEIAREETATKKFSFRILGLSLLLTLLIVLSALIVALSVLFAVKNVESEIVLGFRDIFFDRLGITDPSQYNPQKVAFAIGQFSLPLIFGIMTLIAVCRRKRFFAVLLLLILTAIGYVTEAPAILAIPVLCLILVLLPGRSAIWRKAK